MQRSRPGLEPGPLRRRAHCKFITREQYHQTETGVGNLTSFHEMRFITYFGFDRNWNTGRSAINNCEGKSQIVLSHDVKVISQVKLHLIQENWLSLTFQFGVSWLVKQN